MDQQFTDALDGRAPKIVLQVHRGAMEETPPDLDLGRELGVMSLLDADRDKLRPARVEDYEAWLRGFVATGGKVTHPYTYPFARAGMRVVMGDITLPPLYGSQALSLILPAYSSITFRDEAIGRSNLYVLNGFRQIGGWVPVYADMAIW